MLLVLHPCDSSFQHFSFPMAGKVAEDLKGIAQTGTLY
jgi:hypothetical protein